MENPPEIENPNGNEVPPTTDPSLPPEEENGGNTENPENQENQENTENSGDGEFRLE